MKFDLNRKVRVIESQKAEAHGELGKFVEYLTVPNIILLGDPGAGKTHTLQAAAKKENVECLSVLSFLSIAESEELGETVYLDGLDEFRSRIKDKNLIIELIKSLTKQGQPRIRLSCRSVDWLGESDLSLFKRFFGELSYVVLSLEPLTHEEIISVLQIKNISEPEAFIAKAKSYNLERLLKNPQTLIMLVDVVRHDIWPETRKELFEKSCHILLAEHNRDHIRTGLGKFSPDELLEPAGEVAASLLISGVAGVSLLDDVQSDDFPSYRTVGFPKKDMIQACLMRRVFSFIDSESESVSYIHRTIAEFLAARRLAEKIRAGHSIRRIKSLIGIEGHPAPELRGFHAWLSVFLPEHSEMLIDDDPYGVLMYGDAASLSLSGRKSLLSALVTLSKTDPWFRESDWSDSPLGPLSGLDMVESFRKILSDPGSSFHLRSIVLEAISNGPVLPQMRDDLKQMVSNPKASYYESSMAVDALLRVVPNGERDVIDIFLTILKIDTTTARLRSKILSRLYKIQFGPADVLSVFQDIIHDTKDHAANELWKLASSLPEEALPEVLDTLGALASGEKFGVKRVNQFIVESAFCRLLIRVLKMDPALQAKRVWQWLKTLYSLGNKRGIGNDDITAWLKQHQSFVFDMLLFACEKKGPDKKWGFWHKFKSITRHSLIGEELARKIFDFLNLKTNLSETDCFLYEICGPQIFWTEPLIARDLIDDFLALAKKHPQLQPVCQETCQCEIEDWRLEEIKNNFERKREHEKQQEENKFNLEKTKDDIAAGKHLNNLGFLASVYWGLLFDINKSFSPIERLREVIGDEHIAPALAGFASLLEREELPTPYDVALSLAENRYWRWWYAILAGINEAWLGQEKSLKQFPDHLLKSAIAIVIKLPTDSDGEKDRGWHKQILRERPDIVESVYGEIAEVCLDQKRPHIEVLYYIERYDETKQWRSKMALKLLSRFRCASCDHLKSLVLAGLYDPDYHDELKELAIHSGESCSGEQKAIWLVVGFLIDPAKFSKQIDTYSKNHDWVIWILIDIVQRAKKKDTDDPIQLSIEQMEKMIYFTGRAFENISNPTSATIGSQNPWDAAYFVNTTINRLAAISERESTHALKRLLQNDSLNSYYDKLRHALADQATVRREAEYQQPLWSETVEALKGGKPANIVDLHALVFDQLQIEKRKIQHSSTDTYKAFWRCDSNGKVDTPEIENLCRDRLIELLKPSLTFLNLHIEREGNMAADKRADILVLGTGGMKLPLELKLDIHADLWTACKNQLDRMYARDPDAAGYGLYVVFWFGEKRRIKLKKPPDGIQVPESAEELEDALQALVPSERNHSIKVIVLDVSPPY